MKFPFQLVDLPADPFELDGILRGVRREGEEEPVVVLEVEDGELRVPMSGIARANLVYRAEQDL